MGVKDPRVQSVVARAVSDRSFVRESSVELARHHDWYVRYIVATSLFASTEAIGILKTDVDSRVWNAAYRNLRCPPDASLWPVEHEFDEGWEAILECRWRVEDASSDTARRTAITRLVNSMPGNVLVQEWAASHRMASSQLLRSLAGSPNEHVRESVAWNPGTPKGILMSLGGDPSVLVQRGVAANPSSDHRAMNQLMASRDEQVQASLRQRLVDVAPLFAIGDRSGGASAGEGIRPAALPTPATSLPTLRESAAVPPLEAPAFDLAHAPPVVREFMDRRGQVDAMAVHATLALAARRGHQAHVMDHANEGFDIHCSTTDGVRLIEVKGVGPTASTIRLSRSQVELAQANIDVFELSVVVTDGTRAVEVITGPCPVSTPLPEGITSIEVDVAFLRTKGESTRIVQPAMSSEELFLAFQDPAS